MFVTGDADLYLSFSLDNLAMLPQQQFYTQVDKAKHGNRR